MAQAPAKSISDSLLKDTLSMNEEKFEYFVEQFADLRILRYNVPDFEKLPIKSKTLLYYLYEAALSGRDILYDQNYKYNLTIRKTLEAIIENYTADKNTEDYKKFIEYAKSVWFSNGIHHHYSQEKIIPQCSMSYFESLIKNTNDLQLPLLAGQTKDDFIKALMPIIFDKSIAFKKVNLDLKDDIIKTSAVNLYEGVTQKEVVDFYAAMIDSKNKQQPMYGLNSKVVKKDGKLVEEIYKVGGLYTSAIEKIVYWLEKALPFCENDTQKESLEKLISFYKSGSIKDFDDYNIAWVKDTASTVDVVNGFIEVYQDPLGKKGAFESVVSVKDFKASKRIATIGANAQWFEDNSPIMTEHKKKQVKGISAKVINAVIEAGDAAPSTPIGINLPNNEWIREMHGSKSVNLGNIVEAYEQSAGSNVANEFYYNDDIKQRVINYSGYADKLHTDMHEVIGHASGQLENGVAPSSETLKNYHNALEEGRADLVALYYLYDQKLVDLGVMPSLDYGKAAYDDYITKGLLIQLSRIKPGKDIEEAHMRNRLMVSAWVYEKGKKENVIEKKFENNKTYFVINDYAKLKKLFGDLLREVQRIKSQGDFKAGKALIENYGVKVDPKLHAEIIERYKSLGIAPYAGFIQPKLVPVIEGGEVKDVKVEYPKDFTEQMLYYGKNYAFLPVNN
ncbi:MAG: dihydrofolate reductase [Bacteroidetes bacterium]|nr:dihydrofolate reductase [Bacteroidota bacterium]